MPNRVLREGINSSARINALSTGAEVLYRRLMSIADDYGCYFAHASTVRCACWPTAPDKVCDQDVSTWLAECQRGSKPLITVYRVNGCEYLQINEFQQPTRSRRRFPQYTLGSEVVNCSQPASNPPAESEQSANSLRSSVFVSSDAYSNADAYSTPLPPAPENAPEGAVPEKPTPPREPGLIRRTVDQVDAEQWRGYLGVFGACGRALNEADIGKSLRLWISMDPAERALALEDAKLRAMTSWRTPDLTAMPANHLRDKPWTRQSIPRILPVAAGPPGAQSIEERKLERQREIFRQLMAGKEQKRVG